jgi:hypothetical protein
MVSFPQRQLTLLPMVRWVKLNGSGDHCCAEKKLLRISWLIALNSTVQEITAALRKKCSGFHG